MPLPPIGFMHPDGTIFSQNMRDGIDAEWDRMHALTISEFVAKNGADFIEKMQEKISIGANVPTAHEHAE